MKKDTEELQDDEEETKPINSNRSMFFSFISLVLSIYISPFFGFVFSVLAIYYAFAALNAGEKKLNMILSLLLSAGSILVSVIFNNQDLIQSYKDFLNFLESLFFE